MTSAVAQSIPTPLPPDDPAYGPLLEAAAAPLREAVGDRVQLEVEQLGTAGRWAFLLARMHAPGGTRPDFSGTAFAARAASGGMSDVYVALLQRTPDAAIDGTDAADPAAAPAAGAWRLVEHVIGPGDVAWLDWPERYGAPRALFGF